MSADLIVTTARLRRIFGLAVFLLAIYPWIKYWKKQREARRLSAFFPTSPSLDYPLLGIMGTFKGNIHKFFHLNEQYFKVIQREHSLKAYPQSITVIPAFFTKIPAQIMTIDPEIVKYVTKTKFDSWAKSDKITEVVADGLGEKAIFIVNHGRFFQSDYDRWKLQRRTGMSLFSSKFYNTTVKASLDKNMAKIFRNIDRRLENREGVFDLKEQFFALTVDIIGDVAIDVQLNILDAASINDVPFPKALDDVFLTARTNLIRPGYLLFGKYWGKTHEYHECRKIIKDLIGDVVRDRRKQHDLDKRDDVLSKFILTVGDGVSDEELIDFSFSFFLAGRDTTAASLTWACYLLAHHPELQEKLYEEIIAVFGPDGKKEIISVESLKALPFLDGVVFETLRLFPAVHSVARFAQTDDILPNGCKVIKGTAVSIEIFAMNRNPDVYPDPTMFKPERWIKLDRAVQSYDPFEFPVFMAGPRICLGKDLSLFETKHALCDIIRTYSFKPTPELCKGFDKTDVSLRDGKALYEFSFTQNLEGPLNLIMKRR